MGRSTPKAVGKLNQVTPRSISVRRSGQAHWESADRLGDEASEQPLASMRGLRAWSQGRLTGKSVPQCWISRMLAPMAVGEPPLNNPRGKYAPVD